MALQGSSYHEQYAEPKKPPKKDGFGLDLILVGTVAMILVFLLVPGLRIRVMRMFTVGTPHKIATEVTVWANKGAGYYYCSGSRFYGHGQGSFMKQGDALTLGYQPELGKYCIGKKKSDLKEVDGKKDPDPHARTTRAVSR
jgi:hypothetical protein